MNSPDTDGGYPSEGGPRWPPRSYVGRRRESRYVVRCLVITLHRHIATSAERASSSALSRGISQFRGAVLPGVAGGLCLLLAFFALQMLPVNYAGLLLILFGLVRFALEINVTSYGLLTAGGLASLVFGSMILMDSPAPELQVNLRVVLPVVLGFAGIAMVLVRLGVAARRHPAATGAASMISEIGQALTAIGPEQRGRVATHGEIWRAMSAESIPEGAHVRVTSVDGLLLTVRKD